MNIAKNGYFQEYTMNKRCSREKLTIDLRNSDV
jgi:hypothetical protein